MRGYPQFSFWISIAPDMIYLSHIVIIWETYFPLVGTVLKPVDCIECQKKNKRKVERTVSNWARSCFCQYANHPPFRLLSIKLILHYFCESSILSCEFTLKGKKLRGNVVFTTTAIRIYFAPLALILYTYFN